MRHLALLAAVYALVVALVLPGSLLAQEQAAPAEPPAAEPPAAEPQAAEPVVPEPPAAEPAEPAPAPPQPASASAPAEPVPAAPAPAAPGPQSLGDERDAPTVTARAAQAGSVTISDFQFSPGQITVDQGDTVTWSNDGPAGHSATAEDGSFDTGVFPAGESRSHTFSDAGTFSYICTPHPNMRGTIVVRASQAESEPQPDDTSGSTGGESAQTGDDTDGPTLPDTGADTGGLLLLGALMLLLGAAVRRRARAERTG
jgi:LPXTG-motif cell wall-anchored protein